MKRTTVYCGALTTCAALALALLFGCDNSKKSVITPPAIVPKFLYAASCGSLGPSLHTRMRRHMKPGLVSNGSSDTGSVSGFTVDATTGALTAISGNPLATGLDCPEFLAVDPGQKFLFVPDEGNDLIHSYSIGATGALTENGSPVSQCAYQLTVDPSGKYLIAPDFCSDNIGVYAIASDGSLTAVTGSPFAETSGNEPESAWVSPNGQFVYIADWSDGASTISAFSLSAAGALTEIAGSPFAAGSFTYSISGTPDGKYLYVDDYSSDTPIDGFSVNSTTGALTALSTPSFAGGACWLSVDATGTVLFSTDCGNGNVYSSLIGTDGTLTAAAGSPFATGGSDPWPVAGDPSGKFVYVGDDADVTAIYSYSYSSAGVLTAITGSPFAPAGTYTEGIVVTH